MQHWQCLRTERADCKSHVRYETLRPDRSYFCKLIATAIDIAIVCRSCLTLVSYRNKHLDDGSMIARGGFEAPANAMQSFSHACHT